jgi:hypothetical protein
MLPQRRSNRAGRTAVQAVAVLLACMAPCAAGAQNGQSIAPHGEPASPESPMPAAPPPAAPAPLKILSWNVATSPYAIAMRKIRMAAPSWRTSFGSERRSIDPPAAPQASDFDFDVVLLQGVINPRALRRLFPARRWRLILSPRALASLPRGSVFTAPVSTTEVEAVAVRYRQGLRIITRADVAAAAPAQAAAPPPGDAAAAGGAAPPGVAVKLIDRGRPVWFASIALPAACAGGAGPCPERDLVARWRQERREAGEAAVSGGLLSPPREAASCAAQSIQADVPQAAARQPAAQGQARPLLGCIAELTLD